MSTWTQIAVENQTVTVEPGATVRYGASATAEFIERAFPAGGSVTASNAFFGGDPARGKAKFLFLLVPATAPAPAPTPAPPPADPTAYAYAGPLPPVPAASSTNWDAWNVYLRVETLREASARLAALKADCVSRDKHREATDAHTQQLRLLTQAMHDQPQIIQHGPLTLRALALQLMIDTPRKGGETPDQLAARAVAEAEALMRVTP